MRKKFLLLSFVLFSFCFVFSAKAYEFGNVTLKNGSRGEAVMELQRFLNDNLNLGLVFRWEIFFKLPVIKLSTQTTLCPFSKK